MVLRICSLAAKNSFALESTHTFCLRSILKNTIGPLLCTATGSVSMHLSWCESRYGFIESDMVLSNERPNWNK